MDKGIKGKRGMGGLRRRPRVWPSARADAGVVALDEKDVEPVHPEAGLLLEAQVGSGDVHLDRRAGTAGDDFRGNADFVGFIGAPATGEATPDTSKPATPQTPQQKQLADDTAKLLTLANELKAELDKSSKNTLSLSVIKKAEQVEKLAHKVRDEMKASLQK